MENITFQKGKYFLDIERRLENINFLCRRNYLRRFENGNFIYYYEPNIIIFDINLKEIYKKNIEKIVSLSIINNKTFVALYDEGIYLFSEIDNQEISNNEISKLLAKDYKIEIIYKYKFKEKLNYIIDFIYNKKYIIIHAEKHIYIFKIKLKNKIVFLQSKLKLDDSIKSFIIFRNKYLILKLKSNKNNLICYNITTMKEILPRFNIRKEYYLVFKFFISIFYECNLYNYNDKYLF